MIKQQNTLYFNEESNRASQRRYTVWKNPSSGWVILHENQELKRSLTDLTSSKDIDKYYLKTLRAGAIGVKLLGAGGGGFLLFYVEQNKQKSVINTLKDFFCLQFHS